ncbi:NnrS family protein, partial [Pseudomonas aeruginosa]|nr:NnrS family protein [Pseudomonas aeruginosa]
MQVLDRSRLMAIPPIWRLGFRPFFLGGALFAVLAIALWLAALAGLWSGWQPVGGWLAWHRHEMLFGFGVAIIAGFLLTAVQTWTGVPGLQGKPLALLAGLWLAARLAWLFDAPLALLLVLQLSFLPLLAWAIGRSLWRVRQKRNYPVVGLLLLLTLADALVLLGLFEGNDDWQRRASIAALWLIAGMMNLIGGRVIPFFTQRGLGRQQQVPAIAWLDNGILLGCVLVALLTAAGVTTQPTPWLAGLFAALGGAQLWRLWRWRDRGIWQVPLLWSLHLAYFWIAVAPLGMALWSLGLALAPSQALHALAVGGMGGLILAMLARVTL